MIVAEGIVIGIVIGIIIGIIPAAWMCYKIGKINVYNP